MTSRIALVLALVAAVTAMSAAPSQATSPNIKHVFLVMLENKNYAETFDPNGPAPYLAKTLTARGERLQNYYATGHFSLDNYIAMVSGQAPNPQTQIDCPFYNEFAPGTPGADGQAVGQGCVYPATVQTVADQLEAKGLTWKGYMEDMGNSPPAPATCRHPAIGARDDTQSARNGDQYAAKHNPFVYFHSIIDRPSCAENDVPLDRLPTDLRSAASTPSLAFITPNLCHDGHDAPCVDGAPGGLTSANTFLQTWVPRILASPAYADGGLLIVTFDEAEASGGAADSTACCDEQPGPNTPSPGGPTPGPGGGRIGAVIVSPYTKPGTVNTTAYNHYALLRSIEDIFGLDHLGYAAADGLRAFGDDVFNTTPRPARPKAALRRLSKRCAPTYRLRISVTAPGGVRSVRVLLDGHTIATGHRPRLSVRFSTRRLRPGIHRLKVLVTDRSGQHVSHVARVRTCHRAA